MNSGISKSNKKGDIGLEQKSPLPFGFNPSKCFFFFLKFPYIYPSVYLVYPYILALHNSISLTQKTL